MSVRRRGWLGRFTCWGAALLLLPLSEPGISLEQRQLALAAAFWQALLRGRAGPPPAPSTPPIAGYRVVAAGVPLQVVQVDPKRPGVRIAVATARRGIGSRETWGGMIDRTRPAAAITGTYFCTQSWRPVGSIVIGGRRIHTGRVGTAFACAPRQGAQLVTCQRGRGSNWDGFDTVLRAGPRLLTGGRRTLWPQGEGFRDPAIFRPKRRTAVAITRHGKLLLVATEKPVLLRTMAAALQRLGAVDAMCLDGGRSAGLFYQGKTRVKPRRPLTNLLVVYTSEAQYRRYVRALHPNALQLADAPAARPPG